MKHVVGIIFGLFSGFIGYMAMAMIFGDIKNASNVPMVAWVAFFGCWAGTYWFATKNTMGFTKPMARVSLVGAMLWMIVGFAGVIFSGKAIVASDASSAAGQAGAAIGGGIFATMAGGFSIAMTFCCLLSFFIFWLMGRAIKETAKPDSAEKSCPKCAEDVKSAAVTCRFCGHNFAEKSQAA